MMKTRPAGVKHPVQRNRAEFYVLITLVCFGLSVALTRLFLDLSGYPQIGNSELHIAHVLWGGLLLFLAVLVLLLFANPWVYSLGAVLGGVGVGLFMDEVGKFITQSNDYFYPWAAPIIYTFFLLTVMLYIRVNRRQQHDPRTEMYHALDLLAEVLDHDLEPSEQAELIGHLNRLEKNSDNPDLSRLSALLLGFVTERDLHLAPEHPEAWQRVTRWLESVEKRWFNRTQMKWGIAIGIGVLGVISLLQLGVVVRIQQSPDALSKVLLDLISAGQVKGLQGVRWFAAYASVQGSIGLLQLASAVLLVIGRERNGISFGYLGLLIELTAANLLAFYFDQFSTIFFAVVQLALLLAVIRYRERFISGSLEPEE